MYIIIIRKKIPYIHTCEMSTYHILQFMFLYIGGLELKTRSITLMQKNLTAAEVNVVLGESWKMFSLFIALQDYLLGRYLNFVRSVFKLTIS